MSGASNFRDDIVWLRGIAVLLVVAFHFGAPGLFGGYIGVDIFFVISGFLITGIIRRDVLSGRFSFIAFYERRVRRLLPALYTMLGLAIPAASYFLLSSEIKPFLQSLAGVVTFTSNLIFWGQSGYFDTAAIDKPLLHTWSLGVEEQFYLVFPLIAVALFKRSKRVWIWLGVAAIISFVWDSYSVRYGDGAAAFYLSPLRAWELLIGAIVANPRIPRPTNVHLQRTALITGLALILAPAIGLRAASAFPGINALPPCLGTALFIWADVKPSKIATLLLSPLRFFGHISYSMYLWHWPLFTFYRFSKADLTLTGSERVALFIVTTIVASLSWAYIEEPFRRRRIAGGRRAAFGAAGAASVALLAAVAFISGTIKTDGSPELRFGFDATSYRGDTCFQTENKPIDEAACLTPADGKKNILLWGNSHAAHYYPGLARLFDPTTTNLMQGTHGGCMPMPEPDPSDPVACVAFDKQMTSFINTHSLDLVILSSDWVEHGRGQHFNRMISNIRKLADVLTAKGTFVVVLGPSIQFKEPLPSLLARAAAHGKTLAPKDIELLTMFDMDSQMAAALPATDKFRFISIVNAVCPNRNCPLTVGHSVPLVWDYGHLTPDGSAFVIEKIADQLRQAASGEER